MAEILDTMRQKGYSGRCMETVKGCSEKAIDEYAQKLKVCGHPVRLRILCLIETQDEQCVSELWRCLRQPQPVISQHLAILKEKGIVDSRICGNKRIYSIVDPFVKRIVTAL